jgi:amino acid transporter
VGFSIYFSIGVVADRGLELTPLIFLAAGLMFALTSLSYVEGSAMLRERGGSSSFARRAFHELISFIAGWAILIDYLIVIAAAAITVAHYLTPIDDGFAGGGGELAVVVAVIGLVALLNIVGVTGRTRQARLVLLALAELGLQLLVIVVGLIVVLSRICSPISSICSVAERGGHPLLGGGRDDRLRGIEAASDLAPDWSSSRGPAAGLTVGDRDPADLRGIAAVA